MPTIAELSVLFTANDASFQRTNKAVQSGLVATAESADSASTAIATLQGNVGRLTAVLLPAADAAKSFKAELAGMAKGAAALDKAMDPAKVVAYSTSLARLDGVGSSLAVEFAELQKSVAGLNRAFNSASPSGYGDKALASSDSVKALGASAGSAGTEVAALNAELARTRALVPRNVNVNARSGGAGGGVSLNSLGSASMMVGRSLTRNITMPVLAIGTAAVVVETQFEAAMAKIEALSGISHEQTQKWAEDILQLGPEIGKMPIELAQGMFYVANEIKDSAKAMEVLRNAGGMSAIGMGKTEDDAKALTYILHDYAGSNLTAARATDTLVAATRVGNFNVETLTSNLGKLLPIASHMKIPFEQVAGAIAAMTKEGATVPQATTGIARLFQNVEKPSHDAKKAFEEIGTSAAEVAREMQTDLFGALVRVKEAADAHNVSLTRLFTTQNSWKASLAILGSDLKDSRKSFDEVAHSSGSFGRALNTTAQTDLFKYRQALAQLEEAGIKLGGSLSPIIVSLAKDISVLAKDFSELSPTEQKAIAGLAGMLALMGPLATGIGLVNKASVLLKATMAAEGLSVLGLISKFTLLGMAIAEVLNLFRMVNDITDANNEQNKATALMNSKGIFNDEQFNQYYEARRKQEDERPKRWVTRNGQAYMEGAQQASRQSIVNDYMKSHGGNKNDWMLPHPATPKIPGGGYNVPESGGDGGRTRQPKESQEEREQDQRLQGLKDKLQSLAQTIRMQGNESDAAAAKDELLFGEFATDAQKAQGLAIAMKQLTAANREHAAMSLYSKAYETLSPQQKDSADVLAMTRLTEARKGATEALKAYNDEIKNLNSEVAKSQTGILIAKATSDEDAIALEKYGKAFHLLSDPAHIAAIAALAKAQKDLKAAQYDASGVVFDDGSTLAQKYRDEKNAAAASVDPSKAQFDNGDDAAVAQKKRYLDTYASAMRTLTKEIDNYGKATKDARIQALQFDETGQKMTNDQAKQIVQLQDYAARVKAIREQIDQLAEQGASIISGGVQHIMEHGPRGLGGYFQKSVQSTIQEDAVKFVQSKAKDGLDKLLGVKKQDPMVAAINKNIAALNQNTKALTGESSATTGGAQASGFLSNLAVSQGGSGSGGFLGSLAPYASLIPGFADGGNFSGGNILVGERGPEIINMGNRSGSVTPNNKLGGTVNHNYDVGGLHFYGDVSERNQLSAKQHADQIFKRLKAARNAR